MSANTKIEWADHTFNPWIGCNAISPGCTNCYAADWAKRYGRDFAARTRTKTWGDPVKWNKQHDTFFAQHGRRQRVFCASLADVFDNAVDPQWLSDLFELIRATPNLDWLLLTKRIGNWKSRMQAVHDHLSARRPPTPNPRSVTDEESDAMNWVDAWLRNDVDPIPANVWIGATIVNREELLRDGPKLAGMPARVKFWSVEPMLGDLGAVPPDLLPDWVIVGGESGPGARPMRPDWARSLRDQCEAAGVPFLFKQWGEFRPTTTDYVVDDRQNCALIRKFEDGQRMAKVGKKAAGRLLDGRTWDGVPA